MGSSVFAEKFLASIFVVFLTANLVDVSAVSAAVPLRAADQLTRSAAYVNENALAAQLALSEQTIIRGAGAKLGLFYRAVAGALRVRQKNIVDKANGSSTGAFAPDTPPQVKNVITALQTGLRRLNIPRVEIIFFGSSARGGPRPNDVDYHFTTSMTVGLDPRVSARLLGDATRDLNHYLKRSRLKPHAQQLGYMTLEFAAKERAAGRRFAIDRFVWVLTPDSARKVDLDNLHPKLATSSVIPNPGGPIAQRGPLPMRPDDHVYPVLPAMMPTAAERYLRTLAEQAPTILFVSKRYGVQTGTAPRSKEVLYENLRSLLNRQTFDVGQIKEDATVFGLLQRSYAGYFDNHPELAFPSSRENLLRVVRDLFDPFYERDGFRIIDLFSGPKPLELPNYVRKRKRSSLEDLIYGVDLGVSWANVSTQRNRGVYRDDVLKLALLPSSVDEVRMFNPDPVQFHPELPENRLHSPETVDPVVAESKRILRPGGWIYIAPHTNAYYRGAVALYETALKKAGFLDVEKVPFPTFWKGSVYGRPEWLIRAQKPEEDARAVIAIESVSESPALHSALFDGVATLPSPAEETVPTRDLWSMVRESLAIEDISPWFRYRYGLRQATDKMLEPEFTALARRNPGAFGVNPKSIPSLNKWLTSKERQAFLDDVLLRLSILKQNRSEHSEILEKIAYARQEASWIGEIYDRWRLRHPTLRAGEPNEPPYPVLLVDNDPAERASRRNVLQSLGIKGLRIIEATDGVAALVTYGEAKALNRPFALILSENAMPFLSGLQVVNVIRSDERKTGRPQTPFILVTNQFDPWDANERGVSEAILKGGANVDLELAQAIRRRHAPVANTFPDNAVAGRPSPLSSWKTIADWPITQRGLSSLKRASFDVEQFLREGHSLYLPTGGGRFVFRLSIGETTDLPRAQYGYSLPRLGGVSVDVFDLDAERRQWIGRTDTIMTQLRGHTFGIESQMGGILITPNKLISDDHFRARYPELLSESFEQAAESRASSGPTFYAIWVEPGYRNSDHADSHFRGIGRMIAGLADLAAMAYYGIEGNVFGVSKTSQSFHKAIGGLRLRDTDWPKLWARRTGPTVDFEPILRDLKELRTAA